MNWTILHDFPGPELEQKWREFLTRADFPTHYASPDYFREPFFAGLEPFVVLALEGDQVVGALSGTHHGGRIECGMQWRPQIACDPAADRAGVGLLEGLMREAARSKLIEVHAWEPMPAWRAHGFRELEQEAVVMLDLTAGSEALFKQFAGTRRTDIRKAIKSGLEVSEATTPEDFAAFYEIHRDWSLHKGFTPTPSAQLQRALEQRDSRRLFLARHEDRVVAGTIVRFTRGGIVEYAANCSTPESLRLKPNDLLQWRAIEWACGEGFSRYSFGSTHPFVRKFGGQVLNTYRYRLDRTLLRRHEMREGAQGLARRAFQAMPDSVKDRLRRLRERKSS
ncbi:MAG TPA: GNAT family N-acetyltransferase [Pyrinomonadaceae bacterium]|nr:GNAT family N-acetyltransferase [Pyrinomonadaceae bacterium]